MNFSNFVNSLLKVIFDLFEKNLKLLQKLHVNFWITIQSFLVFRAQVPFAETKNTGVAFDISIMF